MKNILAKEWSWTCRRGAWPARRKKGKKEKEEEWLEDQQTMREEKAGHCLYRGAKTIQIFSLL